MDQVEWRQVALREEPYGLDLLPDKERVEVSDPRNEAATEARWAPVLERLGIPILGVRDVPSEAADFYARLCPAGVYERIDSGLRVNAPNCIDCKATDVLGPRWTPREGGSGPKYKRM